MADNIFKGSKPSYTARVVIHSQWNRKCHPSKLSNERYCLFKSNQANQISRRIWQVGCVDEERLATGVHDGVSCQAKGRR